MEQEDYDLVIRILESMADSDSLIHGDLHPGNIMLQNDELMVIDLAEISTGAAEFDMACLYRDLYSGIQEPTSHLEVSIGLDKDTVLQLFQDFLKKYLGTDNPEVIAGYMKKLGLLYAVNVIPMIATTQSGYKEKYLKGAKVKIIDPVLRPNEEMIKGMLAALK